MAMAREAGVDITDAVKKRVASTSKERHIKTTIQVLTELLKSCVHFQVSVKISQESVMF